MFNLNKELIIPCRKCILILYENELFNGLKPGLLQTALKRGKGYKRAIQVEKRQQKVNSKNGGNENA